MFDRVGCGKEAGKSASELEAEVEERLQQAGWRDRCTAIALDPELEIWVFAHSSHVIEVIANNDEELCRKVLRYAKKDSSGKPIDPKNVMEQLLRKAKSLALLRCMGS
jgi:acylphosphatase